VVVGQSPELNKNGDKLGQLFGDGDGPDNKQVPPKVVDKHH
jgi:hypothetical protein